MNLPGLESVFNLTWHTSLRACVLIIVVLVVQAVAGKRLPARFRYALSLLVLLRLILLVTPASSWSVFNLTRHVHPAPAASPVLPFQALPAVSVALPSNQPPAAISQPSRPSLGRWAAGIWLCGVAVFLLAVLWRGRKFARWVARLPAATNPRLVELVEKCKAEAGVRCAVRIANAPEQNTAAVFGFRRPCLLLPDGMLDTLEHREARLVLLHEFVHIRRHDVLMNWVSVLALALHWFNPLAWVAMRRLRADQELACDAVVLGLIEQAERGPYGRTLLKHLHDFPAARMAVGLVPLITSRHNIKRRIIMITEFKQTGGFARGLFAVLLVALGGLTFTRAADESKPASTNSPQPPSAAASDPILTAGYDTNALEAFIDEQIQKTIRETYYGNRDRLIKSLHEKGTTYEAWRRGQREYWIVRLMREQIAMIEDLKQADAALKVDPDNESLRRLKAEIGQREAEQLGRVPGPDMLKRAPGLEQEKIDLATRVQNAKFLYHMGKYDEAEAILIQVVKNEPSNRSAPYYLDLIKEARYMDRARRVARANGITAGMPLQGATPSAAANDASGRVPTLTDLLFRRLEDWDHQRVMAESDYLELSNVLFHLNNIPSKKLGGALATAYAHQLDPELVDLAGRLQVAKARMVDASNSYGADMPIFKTAKKQLEDAQTAYQNKIDAVMAGIKTRVNEDKGFMQIIQQKEDEIKNSIMEAQKNRP